MLTWLANLLSGGKLGRVERRINLYKAQSENCREIGMRFSRESAQWRELHHRAVQQRDQAGKDLARVNGFWLEAARQLDRCYGERLHFQMVAKTWETNADDDNRSRRGWRWLYEAKCAEWAGAIRDVHNIIRMSDLLRQGLTQERGLREGWEQTAGELQAHVQQGDSNLQRVEAERDEVIQDRDGWLQLTVTKENTIERLEAQVRHYQVQLTDVGLKRDPETGRFRSAD